MPRSGSFTSKLARRLLKGTSWRRGTLKIALVSPLIYPVPPPLSGGTERVVHDLGEALIARGHEVTVFAAEGSETSGTLVACGPAVSLVENHPPGYPAAREAQLLDCVRQQQGAFDIVHCHTEFMHAPALAEIRPRTVTTIHWRVDEADRQFFLSAFPDLPVVAISEAQRRAMPPEALVVGTVYHGLPLERYRAGPGNGGYVAFLGRLTDQKGPDRAIRAARAAGLPIKLAGDIDVGNPSYFEEMVQPLLGADAEYVGPLADDEKEQFLGDAAVLAMPIAWPEPFGLVAIEAMACGTPVAATPFGAMPEVLDQHSGILAPEAQLAQALTEAANLPRDAVRRSFEQRFSSARMAAAYERIYDKLAAG